jgi:RNA polymerase sigma factor (sigma-70 family)
VLAFCLSRLRSREEAEDAVQATFLYAFRALERGIVPRHEAVWLTKIAENVCRSRRRSLLRRARVESCADVELLADSRPSAERNEELDGLPEALAALPDRQRHALLLREWQGLSYREIAESLAVTESAVETLLFRARRSLARRLQGARSLVDLGSLGALLRTFLSSTGGKAVATAAAVGAASVAVAPPVVHGLEHHPAARPRVRATPPVQQVASHTTVAAPAPAAVVSTPTAARHAPTAPARVAPKRQRATVHTSRAAAPAHAPARRTRPGSTRPAPPPAATTSAPNAPGPPPAAAPPPSAPSGSSDPGGVVSGVTSNLPPALPTVDPPPVSVTVTVPTLPPVAGITVPTPPPVTVTTPDLPPILP